MAGISVDSKTSSSVTLYLSGLDETWTNGERDVYWYLGSAGGGIPTPSAYSQTKTATLDDGVPSGGSVTFSGLSAYTQYGVYCEVYHGSTLLTPNGLRGYVTTDYEESIWSSYEERPIDVTTYTQEVGLYLQEYEVYCYPVSFAHKGFVHFYTHGDVDTLGYLSDKNDLNSDYSGPATILTSDDDSGDYNNFDISYYVTANKEYYIYVRGLTGTETGGVSLYITPPRDIITTGYGAVTEKNETLSVKPFTTYRRTVSFPQSDVMTISITSSYPIMVALSTSSAYAWDFGYPLDGVAYADYVSGYESGIWKYELRYYVEPETLYYIWITNEQELDTATVTLNLSLSSSTVSIAKWDWYLSSDTIKAYNAITGTGNGRSTLNFSHVVWNDMVDKVKEIMDVAVGWWDSADYATYYDTKFNSQPYELTAVMFNSLRNNIEIAGNTDAYIGLGYRTGIGKVSSGDYVYGDYFLTLAEYINDCIDNL